MKKKIILFLNFYANYKIYFSLIFLSLLIFFTIFSLINYLNGNTNLVFISIFLLIFIINIWQIFTSYPNHKRNVALSLISTRNKISNNTNLIGAEVGVYRGDYSAQIYKYLTKKQFNLNLYLIDQWLAGDKYNDYVSHDLEVAYQHTKKRFKDNKNINIMKTSSSVASKEFEDEYFDFVYIDANHDYKFVLEDLKLWFPKVKNKGILFGDDYNRPYGVSKAVAEFSYEKKLIVHFTDNGNQYYLLKE